MDMSREEREYTIEQIDKLIRLAQDAQYHRMEGPQVLFEESQEELEKQRRHVLSMDGIEDDY